jgi:gamma-glutamylcyclotransferase
LKTFAYGSNLCWERLRDRRRVPSSIPVAKARLDGWSVEISKYSQADGSGKANIVPTEGAHVWGVIYEFDADEKSHLDAEEGGYTPAPMDIIDWLGATHSGVLVYLANKKQTNLRAFDWYKAYVLGGARQHDLPTEYLTFLEQLPDRHDDDVERQHQNRISDCAGRPEYLVVQISAPPAT